MTSLGAILKEVVLSLYLFKSGERKVKLANKEKELTNAKKSQKRRNHVKSLSNDEFSSILLRDNNNDDDGE